MVHSKSKGCCSEGVDFMHSRIARLNVMISALNRLTARAIDCCSRRWNTMVIMTQGVDYDPELAAASAG
jgi:hypothetical protein